MNIHVFSASAVCSKCGHDDISVIYRQSGYECSYPRPCGMSQFDGEHMDRSCRRCGYSWAESVLSVTEKPAPIEAGPNQTDDQ